MALAEPFDFCRIGPQDPAPRRRRLAPCLDPAAAEPIVEGDRWHLDRLRQVAQSPLMGAEVRRRGRVRLFRDPTETLQQIVDTLSTEVVASFRRAIPLSVQPRRDGSCRQALRSELAG